MQERKALQAILFSVQTTMAVQYADHREHHVREGAKEKQRQLDSVLAVCSRNTPAGVNIVGLVLKAALTM